MVYLVQYTQNRESEAVYVKLNALIRMQEGARKELLYLERLEEKELKLLHEHYVSVAKNAGSEMVKRSEDE